MHLSLEEKYHKNDDNQWVR